MKHLLFFLICLLFLFAGNQFLSAQSKPFIIVFYEGYAPFSFPENGQNTGVLVDVITEVVSKRLNIPLEIKMGPWARMQELVKTGEADAFCTNPTPERLEYTVAGKVPAVSFPYKIFISSDSPKLNLLKRVRNMEELRAGALAKSYKLGAFLGDGWAKVNLEDYGIEIDYAPKLDNLLLKMAYLRTDAYVTNNIVGYYSKKLLENRLLAEGNRTDVEKLRKIVELDPVMYNANFYLCIAKASPYIKYLNQIDEALKQLQKEKFVDNVMKKYK